MKFPSKKNYLTNKILYIRLDEIWSINLADMIDYKTSTNKGKRYIFVILDIFSKYLWAIPLKNKHGKLITQEISNVLTTSNRKPLKIESDRGSELCNNKFQNFLKVKNIHHYYRFTDKGPSLAEGVTGTLRNLLKKPVFLSGNAEWRSELPSVIKQYNETIHRSTKMTPNQASKKQTEKNSISIFNI